MRGERFDWAIDLQGLARSGLFAWLANADLTIGLDNAREGAREGARLFYDVIAPRAAPGTHAVDRYLAVLPPLGVPVHGKFQWLPERPANRGASPRKMAAGNRALGGACCPARAGKTNAGRWNISWNWRGGCRRWHRT